MGVDGGSGNVRADHRGGHGADDGGDDAAHGRDDDTVGVGGDDGSVDSGGVDKRVGLSLSLGLGLSLTLAVVVAVDGGEGVVDSRVDSRVDSGVDSGGGNTVDSGGGNVGVDSRGGNMLDGRSSSVDSTVTDGTNARDDTVAVVDTGDDTTVGQTVGNLPNGVGIGLSLSLGGDKQNKSEGPHDFRRLVLGENWSPC